MYIYNNIFNSIGDERSLNIFVRSFSENIMRYISSVAVEKKVPMQKVFEVMFNKVLENCNTITGTNYILTEEKSSFNS